MQKPRKNYSADEKVAIVRRHLFHRVSVADLCDEHQIQPTLFCKWQAQLLEIWKASMQRKTLV